MIQTCAAEDTDEPEATELILEDHTELPEDIDDDKDIEYDDNCDIQPNMLPRPGLEDHSGNQFVTVVDISGVHHLPVVRCLCPNAAEENLQYLNLGLFPTSYNVIKTLFTFAVLDDFRLANLECKTSAHQYYSKLRRLTCPAFPKMVLNRYTELRRLSRQYQNLKLWKMHGRAYATAKLAEIHTDTPGKLAEEPLVLPQDPPVAEAPKQPLALFCPTCPQPGVNIPGTWEEDPKWWLYIWKFCADGNFKADHLNQINPADDVHLTEGDGFMTAEDKYADYIKDASSKAHHFNHVSPNSGTMNCLVFGRYLWTICCRITRQINHSVAELGQNDVIGAE